MLDLRCNQDGSLVGHQIHVSGQCGFANSQLPFNPLYRLANRFASAVSSPLYSFLFLDRRLLGLFQHFRHRPDDRICHGGYFFVRSYFPLAPILLGFVLGDLLEDNLRRVLLISDGQLSFLWQRPITLTILTVTVLVLLLPLARYLVAGRER